MNDLPPWPKHNISFFDPLISGCSSSLTELDYMARLIDAFRARNDQLVILVVDMLNFPDEYESGPRRRIAWELIDACKPPTK